MKIYISVALLATLSACGGAGPSGPVVDSVASLDTIDVISTDNNALSTSLQDAPVIQTAAPSAVGDVTFASLLNAVRADNGAPPVAYDSRLDAAAQDHAQDMLDNSYFSHVGLDGSTLGSRVRAAGYNFRRVGENIGSGYRTEDAVLNGWVNSPGHQRNNVNPDFEDFGLGYVSDESGSRWVLVLGAEQ